MNAMMTPRAWGLLGVLAMLLVVLMLQGCASITTINDPVLEAETMDQHAFALFGTYAVFESRAATLIQDPYVPDEAKLAIQRAALSAKPVADSGLVLVMSAQNAAENYNPDVQTQLAAWIVEFEPLLEDFVDAVGGVR